MRVRVEGIKAPELRATVDRICGRTRKSRYLNINPVWWFMNDDEQTVDQADWYHREWPYWRRWLYWNVFRNPLQNFRAYVLGASDKNYWVCGREPVMTVQRNDLVPPEDGYQSCVLYGGELWLPRLFLSYSGKSFVWYVGHQPSGFWGSAGADELVGTLVLPPASLASSPSPALDTSASQAAAWQHKRSVSTLIGDLASPRRSSLVPYWCAPDSPDPPVQSERAASRDFDQFSANSGPNACSVQVMNTNIPQPAKA